MTKREEKRTPEETWRALDDQAAADDAADIRAMTNEELDRELAAQGFDPAEERAKGAELAAFLLARREREQKAEAEVGARRARLVQRAARRGPLTRQQVLARIEIARLDPRLPAPAVLMLRKTRVEQATDEELEALLDELEDLVERASGASS
jgi:hypothetical protein